LWERFSLGLQNLQLRRTDAARCETWMPVITVLQANWHIEKPYKTRAAQPRPKQKAYIFCPVAQ
jgi:hypothetical protein